MSYCVDKQVIDKHTDWYTDMGDDNTRRAKLASGKKKIEKKKPTRFLYMKWKFWNSCQINRENTDVIS